MSFGRDAGFIKPNQFCGRRRLLPAGYSFRREHQLTWGPHLHIRTTEPAQGSTCLCTCRLPSRPPLACRRCRGAVRGCRWPRQRGGARLPPGRPAIGRSCV